MTTTLVGRQAEQAASQYLSSKGYTILSNNWRTRWCEIDIVARRNDCIYFVEVKYRSSTLNGRGLDYITPAKVRQMSKAAESWIQVHGWTKDYRLSAIEIVKGMLVSEFLTDIQVY